MSLIKGRINHLIQVFVGIQSGDCNQAGSVLIFAILQVVQAYAEHDLFDTVN